MKCGTGPTWRAKQRRKQGRGSQTPGKDKGVYCTLKPLGGQPRKYWIKSRAYKNPNYAEWCQFGNTAPRHIKPGS